VLNSTEIKLFFPKLKETKLKLFLKNKLEQGLM